MPLSDLVRQTPLGEARGSVTLELALALPLLFGVLFAMIDFGGYFNDRLVLTSAAYNGAKARAAGCGVDSGQVSQVVQAAVGDMITDPQAVQIQQQALGTHPFRRYTVTLRYPRAEASLSPFTQQIDALATIQVKGLALCDPQCELCI